MKKSIISLLSLIFMSAASSKGADVLLADPTILVDGGRYYLYGTSSPSDDGFDVYVSDNLLTWRPAGKALKKGDAFGSRGFWAPQVVRTDSAYYIFYTADEQIAVASSDSPTGPFTNPSLQPIPSDTRRIDPFYFVDDDGTPLLYHVRLEGENKICVQRISADLASTDTTSPATVIQAEPGTWEDTATAGWRVAEGPTVMRYGGKYHLFYSANDFRNPDYAVGHAVADTPEGPWTKSPLPIISRAEIGENGTGHGDVFTALDGTLRYVFHVHASDREVAPRRTLIVTLRPTADGTGFEADPASLIHPLIAD